MSWRTLSGEAPVVVAHRGASSTHPENTLASFDAAIAFGAPFVEFDVRLSSDGVPVVVHDPDLDRTTDATGPVGARTLAELRRVNAGTADAPQPIPVLEELLAHLSGRCGIVVEIKNLPGEPDFTPQDQPLADAALATFLASGFDGPALFVSFNPAAVAAVRARGADVATGLLLAGRGDPRPGLAAAVAARHDMLLPGTWGLLPAGSGFVEEAHAAGMRVGTWTVDDAPTVVDLCAWGLDAIASNDPATAVAAVAGVRP